MVTTGYLGTFAIDTGDEGAFEVFGNCKSIKVPEISVNMVEVLPLSEIAKQFIPGSVDYGTVTAEFYWDKTDLVSAYALLRVSHSFKVTAPPGGTGAQTYAFSGFVEKITESEFQHDNAAMFSLDVRVSGAITLGAAS
ncbi:hypothetical protein [Zavarzinella formosa]|uniref:hypothetical protein n=1 Tax=Zavarzinella formosa TaxID=360055 RepID=UPI0002F8A6C7|nr:hypothetical protein [Zavarzinella formosa]